MATDWGQVIDGILDVGSSYIKDNSRNDYADLLASQEQQNYNESKQGYDAYNDWLTNVYNPGQAANSAASARAAASAHATAQANEAARAAGAAKAGKLLKKRFRKSMKMLQPSIKMANELIPVMGDTYKKSMDGLNLLRGYLETPQMMNRISQAGTPALGIDVGQLPEHMRK
jgi:hypothetical protein